MKNLIMSLVIFQPVATTLSPENKLEFNLLIGYWSVWKKILVEIELGFIYFLYYWIYIIIVW